MTAKPLTLITVAVTLVLFAASLSIGVADFSWTQLFSGSLKKNLPAEKR